MARELPIRKGTGRPKSIAVMMEDLPFVSIIVPARNEADVISACLDSVAAQQDVAHEIIVVDDGSADDTAALAGKIHGVDVIPARALPEGWTGKNNACWTGAMWAKGNWLLFTDADTVHEPHALKTALNLARSQGAVLVSYSPEQELRSFAERMVMPVIFAQLAAKYPTKLVNDPESKIAAANGQFLLVRAEEYRELGGHEAVHGEVLEDVVLARKFKEAGHKIEFHYGGGLVRTRMYRSLPQLVEGWTKNLALLFPKSAMLIVGKLIELAALLASGWWLAVSFNQPGHPNLAWTSLAFAATYLQMVLRVRIAHFKWSACLLAPFGYLFFIILLAHSNIQTKVRKRTKWKGRTYKTATADDPHTAHGGAQTEPSA